MISDKISGSQDNKMKGMGKKDLWGKGEVDRVEADLRRVEGKGKQYIM